MQKSVCLEMPYGYKFGQKNADKSVIFCWEQRLNTGVKLGQTRGQSKIAIREINMCKKTYLLRSLMYIEHIHATSAIFSVTYFINLCVCCTYTYVTET